MFGAVQITVGSPETTGALLQGFTRLGGGDESLYTQPPTGCRVVLLQGTYFSPLALF